MTPGLDITRGSGHFLEKVIYLEFLENLKVFFQEFVIFYSLINRPRKYLKNSIKVLWVQLLEIFLKLK